MRRLALSLLVPLLLAAGGGLAQTTMEQARREGNDLGRTMRGNGANTPGQGQLGELPGYQGTTLPESTYFSDPDRLTAEARPIANANAHYRTVTDADNTRPRFSSAEIEDVTRRGMTIAKDPDTYLDGQQLGGSSGTCTPLPPGAGNKGYYEAVCNKGSKISEGEETCTARLVPSVVNTSRYFYYGVRDQNEGNGFARNAVMQPKVAAGICRVEAATPNVCDAQVEMGAGGDNPASYLRWCKGLSSMRTTAQLYSCSSEIPQAEIPAHVNHRTGTTYLRKEGSTSVTVTRNEGSCPALAGDAACRPVAEEVCTEGPETRMVEGVAVTQSCWAWSRTFSCQRTTQASDCTDLDANRQCRFLRDECLDDPQSGACKVSQRVYSCPLPDEQAPGDKQYICGGDVYCINGDCEPIEREASTEFKDALVALHSLGDAGNQFDPDNLTVFKGERGACSKKIFGASNCCSGKGVPLLTPWLCSAADRALDEKDDKGLCHKVGTYCSDKVLGICVTSRDAYCCFGSKLSRILQEQGRIQLNKPWGKPKDAKCEGFTIDEFQHLDLSKMDFTEVYAEFTDAAKLPDEVETMTKIQQKIEEYYGRAPRN